MLPSSVGVAAAAALMLLLHATVASAAASDACNIKGNINTRGERIYHMPGQKYCDRTRISASRGERWFCSEEAARAAGWRRSRVWRDRIAGDGDPRQQARKFHRVPSPTPHCQQSCGSDLVLGRAGGRQDRSYRAHHHRSIFGGAEKAPADD